MRVEEFVEFPWCRFGRPPHDRGGLANAFVAKEVLGLPTTTGRIERLKIDRALRRICGFAFCKSWPSEATFSRVFEEFAQGRLAERVHESLIKEHLGEERIGHLSRDGTAIEARERPKPRAAKTDEAVGKTARQRGRLRRRRSAPAGPGISPGTTATTKWGAEALRDSHGL